MPLSKSLMMVRQGAHPSQHVLVMTSVVTSLIDWCGHFATESGLLEGHYHNISNLWLSCISGGLSEQPAFAVRMAQVDEKTIMLACDTLRRVPFDVPINATVALCVNRLTHASKASTCNAVDPYGLTQFLPLQQGSKSIHPLSLPTV